MERSLHHRQQQKLKRATYRTKRAELRFRVVCFLVHDEPIWRFSDQIALLESHDRCDLTAGESSVTPCDEGMLIYTAVDHFDDFDVAFTDYGKHWITRAVTALKGHFRQVTPTGVLQLYRDPIDGTLRNLAD
jgi:hypothetical protein